MKPNLNHSFSLIVLLFFKSGFSQIVFTEGFGTGCSTGTLATSIGWTNTNTGTNQVNSNIWYVSAAEDGVGVGNCGAGCGINRTLHVSSDAVIGGDLGAAYFESSAFFCAFLGLCSQTSKRIESPTINCTGVTNLPFTFEYIENGEGANDNATVWYSADNGATWIQMDDPPKTSLCPSGQGLWAGRSLTLPVICQNNPTVRIGFQWVNNANGVGTDPSFAVDNIQIGVPIVLGADMVNMFTQCEENGDISIHWITKNEKNSDLYLVMESLDGLTWNEIGRVNSNNIKEIEQTYSYQTKRQNQDNSYYRLIEVDEDGLRTEYPPMILNCLNKASTHLFPNPSSGGPLTIQSNSRIISVGIFSIDGSEVEFFEVEPVDILRFHPTLQPGNYFVKIQLLDGVQILPLVVIH